MSLQNQIGVSQMQRGFARFGIGNIAFMRIVLCPNAPEENASLAAGHHELAIASAAIERFATDACST
jgi:hypothetical protein